MIFVPISFLFLILKSFIFFKIYKLKINAIFLNFINICILYDIAGDLSQIISELEIEDRPWWYNIFLGTGVLFFLSKNHALRNIFIYLNKDKININIKLIFILISIFFGFLKIYFSIKYFIENNYIRDFIKIVDRNKFELAASFFATNIYNFFLILPSIFIFIRNLNKKNDFSIRMKREYFYFFYFGVFPKIILDLLATRFFEFITFLFYGGQLPFYSLIISFFVNFCSIYFAYRMYIFCKYIEKVELIDRNEINNLIEVYKYGYDEDEISLDINVIINHRYILELEKSEKPLEDLLIESSKKTISDAIDVNYEDIEIDINFNKNSKYYTVFKKEELKDFFIDREVLNFDTISDYINLYYENYLFEENYKYCEIATEVRSKVHNVKKIYDFMKENNLKIVIPWFKNYNNNSEIEGLIIIKNSFKLKENFEITNNDIIFLLKMKIFLSNLQKKIKYQIENNIVIFKSNLLSKQLEKLKITQDQFLENVLKSIKNIKNGILLVSKKRKIWINKPFNQNEEKNNINDFIEKIAISKNLKDEVFFFDKEVIVANKVSPLKKGYDNILFSYIPILNIVKNNRDELAFSLTDFGLNLEKILIGFGKELIDYKNKIIKIAKNLAPHILIGELKTIEILLKIMIKADDAKLKIYDFAFYNRNIDLDFLNLKEFIEDKKSKVYILFKNINLMDRDFQKKIIISHMDFYLNKNFKDAEIDLRFFYHIPSIDFLVFLNEILLKIAITKEINDIEIENLLVDDPIILIKNISFNLLEKDLSEDEVNFLYDYLNKIDIKNLTLTEFVKLIDKLINEDEILNNIYVKNNENKYVKEAIKLGREALKNEDLMFKLISIFNNNQSEIASLLGVNKSSVSRFFKRVKERKKTYFFN